MNPIVKNIINNLISLSIGLTALGSTCYAHNSAPTSQTSAIDTNTDTSRMTFEQGYEAFQADADIIRLQHLEHWVTIIEQYHNETGKYPFQGESDAPIYVFVATKGQQEYIAQGAPPPAPATTRSIEEFVNELESGLGFEINELYDPQYAPDVKPNFYMYMVTDDYYNFAVHTHASFPFSKQIAKDYNKVEVSNLPNYSANLVLTPNELFTSESFIEAVNQPVLKPGFFYQREGLTLHATKSE